MGILEFAEDREIICKDEDLDLVRGRLSLISHSAFWKASVSALKLVEYFPVGMVMRASPSLHLMCTQPPPSRVASDAEPSV